MIEQCLALFDQNCPTYFAPNERDDYVAFLRSRPSRYYVVMLADQVVGDQLVGAFGVAIDTNNNDARIQWIMASSDHQGRGVGKLMMRSAMVMARDAGATEMQIAASHLSVPFFAHYGAVEITRTEHGWGPDMHRVDMTLSLG